MQPGSNPIPSITEKTNLYRVTLKVRPSKDHPRFWEIQFGYLHICLFGADQNEVAGRSALPELLAAEARAKDIGVSFYCHNFATGVDEGDFETVTPP
jgi:hypothetical protein